MASKVSGLASARKMAKKGGQASLLVEVNNDDDWASLLERQGLVVVDVYTDWCGPCLAMMSNLKKLKLESGVDQFHLAAANASNIKALTRFRGKSEPTWMIIGLPFDELTPEEIAKLKEMEGKRILEEERQNKQIAEAKDKVRRRNLERLSRVMHNCTCVVFFPPSIVEPEDHKETKRVCEASYKLMAKYDTVGLQIVDQLDVDLSREELAAMMYNSGIVLPEELLNMIDNRACIASLVQEMSGMTLERQNSSSSQPSLTSVTASLDLVEKKLATLVYGEQMDPTNPAPESICKMYEKEVDGIKLIPCWTPLEHISKSAAVDILFPTKVANYNVPFDILPPPSFVIIFEAKRAHEILDAAKQFAEDILHVGYFDSIEPDKAKKVAATIYELEKKGEGKVIETKMVMALKKTTSDPMLILAQMSPLYISSDLVSGTKEMELFFPPQVEVVEEPDPWAPPPPEQKVYWMDEEENVYVEEDKITFDGNIIKGRRLIKQANGTKVEDGEWKPIPKDEPGVKEDAKEEEGGEGGVSEDICLMDDSDLKLDLDAGSLAPTPQALETTETKAAATEERV